MVNLAAMAHSGLKFCAVLRNTRLPYGSAFHALTVMPTRHPAITIGASSKNNDQKALSVPRPMSPVMADSKMYGRPLNSRASRGADGISTPCKRTRSFDQVTCTENAFSCTGQLTFPPNVYLMGKPPVCTTVPAAVGVKNAGMPAPPARSRSASVPCGVSSTSSSPPRYCRANSLFSPGIRHVAVDISRRARSEICNGVPTQCTPRFTAYRHMTTPCV